MAGRGARRRIRYTLYVMGSFPSGSAGGVVSVRAEVTEACGSPRPTTRRCHRISPATAGTSFLSTSHKTAGAPRCRGARDRPHAHTP
jgi:hypothetical protein